MERRRVGQWRLLDHFDHDGRRFLVARKHPPSQSASSALDGDERMIAGYAALGRSGKSIAYELRLSTAAVSRALRSALKKLGLRNAAELANVLGELVPLAEGPRRAR